MTRSLYERVLAATIMVVGFAFFYSAIDLRNGANAFPQAVAAVMVVAAGVIFVRSLRKQKANPLPEGPEDALPMTKAATARVTVFMALSVLYAISVGYLGYFTSSVVFIPATAYLFGYRRFVVLIASVAIFLLLAFSLFDWQMNTPFPDERLIEMLGGR